MYSIPKPLLASLVFCVTPASQWASVDMPDSSKPLSEFSTVSASERGTKYQPKVTLPAPATEEKSIVEKLNVLMEKLILKYPTVDIKDMMLTRQLAAQLMSLPLSGVNPISASIDNEEGSVEFYVNLVKRTKLTVLHYNDEDDDEVMFAIHQNGELVKSNRSTLPVLVNQLAQALL